MTSMASHSFLLCSTVLLALGLSNVNASSDYAFLADTHCGDSITIETLGDSASTPSGWTGGEIAECMSRCDEDDDCAAFVWRDSDESCLWKSQTLAPFSMNGHDCYIKPAPTVSPTTSPTTNYAFIADIHCGGGNVSPLGDSASTPYGWKGGELAECTSRCDEDDDCAAFVYRYSDGGCFWKSQPLAPYNYNGHGCYVKPGAVCSSHSDCIVDYSFCATECFDGDGCTQDDADENYCQPCAECHSGLNDSVDGSCDLCAPTVSPTTSPTTTTPTVSPTTSPTTTTPTVSPTTSPTTTLSPTVTPTTAPTTSPTPSPTTSPTEAPTPSPSTSPTNAPTAVCDLRFGSDDIEKTWMSEYTISDGVVTVKVQEELEWIIENEKPTLTGQMVACISGFAWSYAEEGCDYREWTGTIGINALLQCSSGVAEDVSVVDGPDISRMRVEFEMSSLRNVEYYMAGVGDPTSIITTRNTLMPMLFDFQKTINVESQNIAVTSMYFPVTEVVATLTGSDDGEPLTDDEKDEITNSIAAHFNFPSAAIKFTFAESGSIVVTAQVPSDVSTTCAALTFTSFSAVVECTGGQDFASIREVTERSVISVGWTEGLISGLTAEATLKVYTNMQVPYELVNPQHKNQNSALTYSAFETTGTCSLNVDCEKYFEWTLTDDHASPVCTFSGSYEVEFDVVCSQEYNGYVCPLVGNETITTTVSLESGYHCPDTENAVDIALLATELFSNRVDSDDSETVTDSFLNTQTLKFHADVRADNAGLKDAKFIAISIADVNGGVDLELYNGGLTDSGTLLALAVTDIIDSSTDPESDSSVLSPSFTLIADADTLGLDLQETAVFQVTATIAAVYEADGVRRRALLQVSYDASTETSRTVIISAEDAAMQVLEESAAHNSVSAGLWLALLSVYTAFALHF